MAKLFLIDFDGTITTKDTLTEFIKFSRSKKQFIIHLIILAPLLLLYFVRIISASNAKRYILSYFFKNHSQEELFTTGRHFIEHLYTQQIIKKEFIDLIATAQQEGSEIAIVSASPDIWILPFCERNNLICICTELQFTNGLFTGQFATPNCNNKEKAIRIHKQFTLANYNEIYAYGNSNGDNEMFKLATQYTRIKPTTLY